MKDSTILVLLCLALAAHLLAGVLALRKVAALAPLVMVNLAIGLALLSYWIGEWYGYIFNGIQWHATDQLLPLYALLICVFSALYFAGKNIGAVWHWSVFGIDLLAVFAAVLFFIFFKIDKLF